MEKNAKIFVAGHRGLVGSAILKNLREKGYKNFVLRTHKELDLCDQLAVTRFFDAEKPSMFSFRRLLLEVLSQIVCTGQILFIVIYKYRIM